MKERPSRRDLIGGIAAAGAMSLVPGDVSAAEKELKAKEMTPERAAEIRRETDAIGKITDELEKARERGDMNRERKLLQEFRIRAERALKLLQD